MRLFLWFKILALPIIIFGIATLIFFVYDDVYELPKDSTKDILKLMF